MGNWLHIGPEKTFTGPGERLNRAGKSLKKRRQGSRLTGPQLILVNED